MAAVKEQVHVKLVNYNDIGDTAAKVFERLPLEDVKDFDDYLRYEIVYWGKYNYGFGISQLNLRYIKNHYDSAFGQISETGEDGVQYIKNLYYVSSEQSDGKTKYYLYDESIDQVYKIPLTRIGKHKVHSVEELDFQQGKIVGSKEVLEKTLIDTESDIENIGSVSCYAPELKGFVKERTKALYYKVNENGEIIDNNPKERPIEEYLNNKKIVIDGNYVFYNYNETEIDATTGKVKYSNAIWANIKVEASGVETNWVWIPRYAYKIEGNNTNIIYIDLNNKQAKTREALPEGYTVHPAFEDGKKGIWVSKYEVEQVEGKKEWYSHYLPDLKGFNPETTWVELYKDDGTFTEVKLSTISNIQDFAEKNRWFDYEHQVWANIKTEAYGVECWWVWIPRYAYKISSSITEVIFVDIENKPLSGDELPEGYIVHPAFEDGKKGIWASKYEVSKVQGDEIAPDVPDMSNFNPQTTWVEVYNDDGTFTETKLADIGNINQFAKANRWYDYSKSIWANIKVVNDQGTLDTSDDVETWWVWIPKYAYSLVGDETSIVFLDENGNPTDGSTLLSNYIEHPAFEDGKKGIWVSKYEVSEE